MKGGEFLSSLATVSFSRGVLLLSVCISQSVSTIDLIVIRGKEGK